jgi:hypothetical protein
MQKYAFSFLLLRLIVRKPSMLVMKWWIESRRKFLYGEKKFWKIGLIPGKKINNKIWSISHINPAL